MADVNEELQDRLTGHQIGLHRHGTWVTRRAVATLKRMEERIVAVLAGEDLTEFGRQKQERLLKALRKIVSSVYESATGQLEIDLDALGRYEVEFQRDLFNEVLPVKFELAVPAPDQIVAAIRARPFQGRYLKEWFKGLEDGAYARLRDSVRTGFIEGRTVDRMVRDIRGTRANAYKDGILEIGRRAAETTVRTAVNHTANVAREELYRRNSRLIKGVQWVSTLDGRTTPVCRARDGQVYPLDAGPRPPAHPGCRSATAPLTVSFRDLGLKVGDLKSTRASMDGQVPEGLNYSAWLRKKPKAFQEDVLGVEKARLFRDGKIDLDRFVDRAGREYTLDELRQREKEAWQKADLS